MNHLRLVYIGYYENLADDTKLKKEVSLSATAGSKLVFLD